MSESSLRESLEVVVVLFGTVSLINDAASMSFVPRLVPRDQPQRAHARLDGADAVGQTAGPAVAAVVIRVMVAPLSVLVDALTYLLSAVVVATLRSVPEPSPSSRPRSAFEHWPRRSATESGGSMAGRVWPGSPSRLTSGSPPERWSWWSSLRTRFSGCSCHRFSGSGVRGRRPGSRSARLRPSPCAAITVFAVSALILALSPIRRARIN